MPDEPLDCSHLGSDIWVFPKVLSPELCSQVVELYDVTEPKIPRGGSYDNRECEFLYISALPTWSDIDTAISKVVGQVISTLCEEYKSPGNFQDEGYQVCCYESGEIAVEHFDGSIHPYQKLVRMWAIAAYFNEFEGGEVVFSRQGITITPEVGMVAVWPPHVTHPHRTLPAKDKRYTMITWSVLA